MSKMTGGMSARRIALISSVFIIGSTLSSCTTTSINQNGSGDNACANEASCTQRQRPSRPSGHHHSRRPKDSSPVASSSTGGESPATPAPQDSPQYRPVSFAVLCSYRDGTQGDFQECSDDHTANIGANIYDFSSWGSVYDPASDEDPPLLSLPSTSCRSISLRFAIQQEYGTPPELRMTVSVVSRGSQSVTIAPNQLGRLHASLNGGPFEIDASANRPLGGGWTILMDGSASCSTNSGV